MSLGFLNSFQLGIDSAIAIQRDKNSIEAKLQGFSDALATATNGRLAIRLEMDETKSGQRNQMINGCPDYLVLAFNPSEKKPASVIARWRSDPVNGFPCELWRADSKWICTNIEEIETAFSELVANPIVAIAFLEVMGETVV